MRSDASLKGKIKALVRSALMCMQRINRDDHSA